MEVEFDGFVDAGWVLLLAPLDIEGGIVPFPIMRDCRDNGTKLPGIIGDAVTFNVCGVSRLSWEL